MEVTKNNELIKRLEENETELASVSEDLSNTKEQLRQSYDREGVMQERFESLEADLKLVHKQYKADEFRKRYAELVAENKGLREKVFGVLDDLSRIGPLVENVAIEHTRNAEAIEWGNQQVIGAKILANLSHLPSIRAYR